MFGDIIELSQIRKVATVILKLETMNAANYPLTQRKVPYNKELSSLTYHWVIQLLINLIQQKKRSYTFSYASEKTFHVSNLGCKPIFKTLTDKDNETLF